MQLKHATVLAALLASASASIAADQPVIGLITKTETNPFFVKMKEGAAAAAKAKGAKLLSGAGKTDGDNAGQVTAIENMIAAGAKTILITPSDTQGHRAGDQEGAGKGRDGDRAGQPDRPGRRHRRAVRHRQLQGRRADRPVRQGGDGRQAGQDRHARPVPRPPGRRAAPQRLPEGLRPRRARRQEQRTRQGRRGGVHGRQLRRPGQGPDGDGELPAEEPRHQPRLHHQRARRRRRLQRRSSPPARRRTWSSSRSTAAARASRTWAPASIAATVAAVPAEDGGDGRRGRRRRTPRPARRSAATPTPASR